MNLRTRLRSGIALLAALAILFGIAAPTLAADPDSNSPINVELNDVGTFSFWLWYAGGVNLSSVDVATNQGGVSTGATSLTVVDTRTNSPGWTLYIKATDFSDGHDHSIPVSNFTLTAPNNANLSCPGTPVPSNPFQVLTRAVGTVNLSTTTMIVSATAGRGCGQRSQGLNLSVSIPAGTYATDYTSTLTLTTAYAP